MVGHKGGRCHCGLRVTHGNIDEFHFHHREYIGNGYDLMDRWAGAVRFWAPFTEDWFAWGDNVDLICLKCHQEKHRNEKQLSMEEFWEVQCRLDSFDPGALVMHQPQLPLLTLIDGDGRAQKENASASADTAEADAGRNLVKQPASVAGM